MYKYRAIVIVRSVPDPDLLRFSPVVNKSPGFMVGNRRSAEDKTDINQIQHVLGMRWFQVRKITIFVCSRYFDLSHTVTMYRYFQFNGT